MISISGPLLAKYDSNSKIARDLNSITLALSKKDSSLWGEAAEKEASVRLNWIDLPVTSRDLLPQIEVLRNWVKEKNWAEYQDKNVAIFCSADAIVPTWAYMLIASRLRPVTNHVYTGSDQEALKQCFLKNIQAIDVSPYADQRVVVKGCGDVNIPEYAYLEITNILLPVVKSLMYGEPCSTVPVYKKK